jgi:hypothetical protein
VNERALENWLTNANELAFQIPFAYSLAAEGYRVVHVSRHCAMEMGKDILAISPKGVPCAFQLKNVKGKQLTLKQWRADLEKQILSLVHTKIVHPSITSRKPHRSYIVINGEFSEEVSRWIGDFNDALIGRPKLGTIVRGELLDRFKKLGSNFWPPEISFEFKMVLELLLSDGRENLPKAKFADLLEAALHLESGPRKSRTAFARTLAGAAILFSYVLNPWLQRENHAATFEAWTILFAHILAFAEKNKVPEKAWFPAADLASAAMLNALGRLSDELATRKVLWEGNPLTDRNLLPVRVTCLLALLSLYNLWQKRTGTLTAPEEDFARKFIRERTKHLFLWGEAVVPQFLSLYFYLRTIDSSLAGEQMLASLVRAICSQNHPRGKRGLPSPYYDAEQVLLDLAGDDESHIKEKFTGSSYSLESLLHLLVRLNLKQTLKGLWPAVSRVGLSQFTAERAWRFFQWKSRKGITTLRLLKPTQSWPTLVKEASEVHGKDLPPLLRQFPIQCLAVLLVYPHRLTSSCVRWLDHQLWKEK